MSEFAGPPPGEGPVAPQGPVTAQGLPVDPPWERLSPLSLVLRGGLVLVAVLGWIVSQLFDEIVKSVTPQSSGGGPDGGDGGGGIEHLLAHPVLAVAALAAVLAVVAFGAWMTWRFTRYRISRGHVELRKGWIFREQRQVPMERIQAVEIGRPLLAQLLGLAQVVVQSAGGKDSNVTLAFLPLARAQQVRDEIQAAAAASQGRTQGARTMPVPDSANGSPGHAGAPVGQGLPGDLLGLTPDAGRPVITVPNGRLFLATLLHSSVVWLVIGVTVWFGAGFLIAQKWGSSAGFVASLPAVLPAAFAMLSGRVRELLKHGNFAMTDHGDAVRIVHGLTDHRTTTVPLHRIQAIELLQPLWWRPMRWWRARVNVAGVHGEHGDPTNETVVLPVGLLDQAVAVLTLLDAEVDPEALRTAALGEGGETGWVTTPPSARWLDPWSWRRRGYAVSGHGVLIRSGRFSRSAVVVPHSRIQSISLDQGPLDRALTLSSVTLVSTPGPVTARIEHLCVDAADRFLAEETARAAAARTRQDAPTSGLVGAALPESSRQAPATEHTGSADDSWPTGSGPTERDQR